MFVNVVTRDDIIVVNFLDDYSKCGLATGAAARKVDCVINESPSFQICPLHYCVLRVVTGASRVVRTSEISACYFSITI